MKKFHSDLDEILSLLEGKEGENLEFKEAKSSFEFDRLARYCAALANEGGGKVVLGITDKRPREVVGTKAFSQPERTRNDLSARLHLDIDFEELFHPENGRRVLVFVVPARPLGMPVKDEGRYWMRRADSLVPMTESRLQEIFAESSRDFSALICSDASMEDLDLSSVENFRRKWVEKKQKAGDDLLAGKLASMSLEELLADAEAVVDGQITYAALILFGTRSALGRYLSQAELVFEYRSADSSGPAQERSEYRQGFFAFYDDLWERINLRNDKQDFQQGLFVAPIATFNERVIREAVLNAVSHRNYQFAGSIFIRQYPRRLEIDSPGGLPLSITVDNILDRQEPRNRRIAEIFTRCGLVERSGQGMNLIFEESIRQGKPLPAFARTDPYQVGLTLYGTVEDPAFVRFVESVGNDLRSGFNTQDWLVLAAIGRGEKVPKAWVGRLKHLADLGIIEPHGKGRYMLSRRYYEFIGDRPAYTRKKGLDREQNLQLLLNHIISNAKIGSKLEELCHVLPALPPSSIRSLLRTLKNRGQIYSVGYTNAGRWYPASDSRISDALK